MTPLQRRSFLGGLGVLLGGAALAGCDGELPPESLAALDEAAIGTTPVRWVDTLAFDLVQHNAAQIGSSVVVARGHAAIGDGGGGLFVWTTASALTDFGTIFAPTSGGGTWRRVFAGPVDVRWFGADATGAADATVAFTRALASPAGRHVLVPAGEFRLDGSSLPVVPAGARLSGVGPASVLFRSAPGGTMITAKTGAVIEQLVVQARLAAQVVGVRASGDDVLIEACLLDNLARGVVAQAAGLRVAHCRYVGKDARGEIGYAIEATASRTTIAHCTSTRAVRFGLDIAGGDTSVTGGAFIGGGGDGIRVSGAPARVLILAACANANSGHGIHIESSAAGAPRDLQIASVTCRGNAHGLRVGGSGAPPQRVAIEGGVYNENRGSGIALDAVRDASIEASIVRRNLLDGVVVGSAAVGVDVTGLVAVANGGAGTITAGLLVFGRRVRVRGGQFVGKDGDAIVTEADFDALPLVQHHAVRWSGPFVDGLVLDHIGHAGYAAAQAQIWQADGSVPATAAVRVNASGHGAPDAFPRKAGDPAAGTFVVPGSPGSTFHNLEGGDGVSFFVRATTGWAGH